MDRETEDRVEGNVRRKQRVVKPLERFTYDTLGEPSYQPWRAEAKALWTAPRYIPHVYAHLSLLS